MADALLDRGSTTVHCIKSYTRPTLSFVRSPFIGAERREEPVDVRCLAASDGDRDNLK